MTYKLTKSQRKRKYGSRWAKWKRAQRAHPSPAGKKGKLRRHHTGGRVVILSPMGHAARHKKSGTAGGRPRKRKA